ncbi:MAG: hypothetical protein AAFN27_20825 [Pseudomonadota bacterium]
MLCLPAWSADLDADIESLEACVLENGATGHEQDCIGILHDACAAPLCYKQEMALWRIILLNASSSNDASSNRKMLVGDWTNRVASLKQACLNGAASTASNLRDATCERDAYAQAAMEALLGQ